MNILPVYKGYTIDFRLKEFRRVSLIDPADPDSRKIEFIPFKSPLGKKLFADLNQKGVTKFIGVWTVEPMQETSETPQAVEKEFNQQENDTDDWF